MRKLRSFRWQTLTRKGFIIAGSPVEPAGHWSRANALIKHPTVLVFVGFVLTGVVGNWLGHVQDEKVREREATVKSMDDLRASIDDISLAFHGYLTRTNALIDSIERQAPASEVVQARAAYATAADKWDERLSVDGPNLRQRFPTQPVDPAVAAIMNEASGTTNFIADCITSDTVEPLSQPFNGRSVSLVCPHGNQNPPVAASTRLMALSFCLNLLTSAMRPDPKSDFNAPALDNRQVMASKMAMMYCDRNTPIVKVP